MVSIIAVGLIIITPIVGSTVISSKTCFLIHSAELMTDFLCLFLMLCICSLLCNSVAFLLQVHRKKHASCTARVTVLPSVPSTTAYYNKVYMNNGVGDIIPEVSSPLQEDDRVKQFRESVKNGMQAFMDRNLPQALENFNKASKARCNEPLIQRGILLYCLVSCIRIIIDCLPSSLPR